MEHLIALTGQFLEQGRFLRGWSAKTVTTYQQNLTTLRLALGEAPITKSTLQQFVIWMRDKGLTAGGCNVRIRAVNSFLTWLHEEGHTGERLRVKLLRAEHKTPRTISVPDIHKLLHLRPTAAQLRMWTLIVLLLDTGLRINEALTLERKNVDLDQLFLRVKGKGNKERLVPISTEGRKHLFRWLSKTQGRYVFTTKHGGRISYRNAYRGLQKLSSVNPHGFRHSFAVNYMRNGGDIYRLSRILGHASINTTQLYLRSLGVDALREVHDTLSPLTIN